MTSSLRHRNYRLFYFFGQLISVIGTWMQTIAQSFLVLEMTHSGTQLGLTTAVRFLPMLFSDRPAGCSRTGTTSGASCTSRRPWPACSRRSSAICLAAGAGMHLWVVYVLAAALGFVNVFDNPARQSFISEMVPGSRPRRTRCC